MQSLYVLVEGGGVLVVKLSFGGKVGGVSGDYLAEACERLLAGGEQLVVVAQDGGKAFHLASLTRRVLGCLVSGAGDCGLRGGVCLGGGGCGFLGCGECGGAACERHYRRAHGEEGGGEQQPRVSAANGVEGCHRGACLGEVAGEGGGGGVRQKHGGSPRLLHGGGGGGGEGVRLCGDCGVSLRGGEGEEGRGEEQERGFVLPCPLRHYYEFVGKADCCLGSLDVEGEEFLAQSYGKEAGAVLGFLQLCGCGAVGYRRLVGAGRSLGEGFVGEVLRVFHVGEAGGEGGECLRHAGAAHAHFGKDGGERVKAALLLQGGEELGDGLVCVRP